MRRNQDEGVGASVVRVLQQTVLFAGVPLEELKPLADGARQRTYAARQRLARDDCQETLLVVERGALRLFRSCAAGNEVTLGTFPAGTVLGLSPYAATVIAASTLEAVEPDTRIHVLPRRQVDAVLRQNPTLALTVIAQLGQQVEALCERIEELALHPVRVRLAHELGNRAQPMARNRSTPPTKNWRPGSVQPRSK